MTETEYFFVYGSLMEGFFNYDKALKDKVVFCAPARVKGKLYHQCNKGYPALISGERYVYGELIRVRDYEETLLTMDEIENYRTGGTDNEYQRRLTAVTDLTKGNTVNAYVYWYGREDLGEEENPAEWIP